GAAALTCVAVSPVSNTSVMPFAVWPPFEGSGCAEGGAAAVALDALAVVSVCAFAVPPKNAAAPPVSVTPSMAAPTMALRVLFIFLSPVRGPDCSERGTASGSQLRVDSGQPWTSIRIGDLGKVHRQRGVGTRGRELESTAFGLDQRACQRQADPRAAGIGVASAKA